MFHVHYKTKEELTTLIYDHMTCLVEYLALSALSHFYFQKMLGNVTAEEAVR